MSPHNKIIEVRPKAVFQKIEQVFSERDIDFLVKIPSSQIVRLHLLESAIIVSLIKLTNPLKIFEFGTYMGATTVLMATNSPKETHVSTLDIDDQKTKFINDSTSYNLWDAAENDNFLRKKFKNEGAIHISRSTSEVKSKITQIFCDSKLLDLDKLSLKNKFDLIFIDGGHDYETVENDTSKAFSMATEHSIIIWHDYKSQIHQDVTHFLNSLSHNQKIIHIQNTMLAIHCIGDYSSLIV